MALVATISINAQVVKVYKNGETEPVATYTNTATDKYKVVFEKATAAPKTFTVKGVTFKMMPVEGGTFSMGSMAYRPVHQVTLSDYYIGETEVTQALWYAVMGASPSSSCSWGSKYGLGDNYPAYYISWEECQTFITNLNTLTNATFRMPTEAEWEYAARGGSESQGYSYSGSKEIEDVGWYRGNTWVEGQSSPNYGTHQVKTKSPNELGIYDMTGNVEEWCSDWYGVYSRSDQTNPTGATSGSSRVIRGGGWTDNYPYCEVDYRTSGVPSFRDYETGLRLALSQE